MYTTISSSCRLWIESSLLPPTTEVRAFVMLGYLLTFSLTYYLLAAL